MHNLLAEGKRNRGAVRQDGGGGGAEKKQRMGGGKSKVVVIDRAFNNFSRSHLKHGCFTVDGNLDSKICICCLSTKTSARRHSAQNDKLFKRANLLRWAEPIITKKT